MLGDGLGPLASPTGCCFLYCEGVKSHVWVTRGPFRMNVRSAAEAFSFLIDLLQMCRRGLPQLILRFCFRLRPMLPCSSARAAIIAGILHTRTDIYINI